jgi:hypothetical protein
MTNTSSTVFILGLSTSMAFATYAFSVDAAAQQPARDSPNAVSTESTDEPLGARGQWFLGAEDLFRVTQTVAHHTYESGEGADTTTHRNSEDRAHVQVLWPTLALDWFPIPGLSAGLSARYEFAHDRHRYEGDPGASAMEYETKSHRLSLSPRIGYALPLVSDFGLWARVAASNRVSFDRYSANNSSSWPAQAMRWTTYEIGVEGSLLATYNPARMLTVVAGPGVYKPLHDAVDVEPDLVPVPRTIDDDRTALFFTIGAGLRL